MLLRNKFKLGRVITMTLPFILSILFLVSNALVYFNYEYSLFTYISGHSLLPILYLYLNSYIYNLCSHHRMFIHYLLVSWLLCVYDVYIGIPISDKSLLVSHYLVFGLAVVLYGILKFRDNRRSRR